MPVKAPGIGSGRRTYSASSLPTSWEDLSLCLEAIFSLLSFLKPTSLLLPLASSSLPSLSQGYVSPPTSPWEIPELRVGLPGPRGGCGTVPHALHDVARHSQCTGKGTLLPFARFKVNCLGSGDTPCSIPANLLGCGVSLPCLLSRHLQSCSNLPQETTKKFEPVGFTPSSPTLRVPSLGQPPPRVPLSPSSLGPPTLGKAATRAFPSASRASELFRTPRGPTGQSHTPPTPHSQQEPPEFTSQRTEPISASGCSDH